MKREANRIILHVQILVRYNKMSNKEMDSICSGSVIPL